MAQCRVVQGETIRLPLSDGDWIDVKRELNAGEYVDLLRDMADRKAFSRILAYVLGWSLVDLDGKPLPWDIDGPETVRRDMVRSLTKATARELTAAIDRHERAEEAALDAKKKTPTTSPTSNPTSASAAP
jgi:hypothetical protein